MKNMQDEEAKKVEAEIIEKEKKAKEEEEKKRKFQIIKEQKRIEEEQKKKADQEREVIWIFLYSS